MVGGCRFPWRMSCIPHFQEPLGPSNHIPAWKSPMHNAHTTQATTALLVYRSTEMSVKRKDKKTPDIANEVQS